MSSRKPFRKILALLMLTSLVLAACGTTPKNNTQTSAPAPTPTASTPPQSQTQAPAKPKGPQILTYAHGLEADSLDPNNYTSGGSDVTIRHVFDRLVEYKVKPDGTTEIVPGLATEWKASADGKVWTLKLRQGVKFHDGTPFNAEAVKFTVDRILNKANGLRSYGTYSPIIESAKVVDAHTVEIATKKKYGAFLDLIATPSISIVSPAAVQKYGKDITANPVGTGPFVFKTWARDDKIELEPNKEYWGGAPKLEKLIIRVYAEPAPKSLALETGETHAIAAVPVDDLGRLGRNKDITLVKVPSARQRLIGINTSIPPLDNKKVRQALNHAIDKEGMVKNLLKGTKIINNSPMAPLTWGYAPIKTYQYDPEKAKALLKEAGVKTPITMHFLALKQARDPGLMDSLQLIREQLKAVGIETTYEETDINAYKSILDQPPDHAKKSKTHLYAQGHGPRLEADRSMRDSFHSASWAPKSTNRGYYKNPEVDRLLDEAAFSTDVAMRLTTYKKVQEIIVDDAPWIFLYTEMLLFGVRNNVKDVQLSTSDALLFHKAYIE